MKGKRSLLFLMFVLGDHHQLTRRTGLWAVTAGKNRITRLFTGHTSAPARNSCEALQSIPPQKTSVEHSHSGVKRRFTETPPGSSACPRGRARYSSARKFKRGLLQTSREEILLERSGWTLSSQTGESAARQMKQRDGVDSKRLI